MKTKHRRTLLIQTRITVDEYNRLQERAIFAGMTIAGQVRLDVINGNRLEDTSDDRLKALELRLATLEKRHV